MTAAIPDGAPEATGYASMKLDASRVQPSVRTAGESVGRHGRWNVRREDGTERLDQAVAGRESSSVIDRPYALEQLPALRTPSALPPDPAPRRPGLRAPEGTRS